MGGASLNVCCFCDTFWLSMSQSAVVHARIDQATKTATEEVLEALGMTPTEAIRLFFTGRLRSGSPFRWNCASRTSSPPRCCPRVIRTKTLSGLIQPLSFMPLGTNEPRSDKAIQTGCQTNAEARQRPRKNKNGYQPASCKRIVAFKEPRPPTRGKLDRAEGLSH